MIEQPSRVFTRVLIALFSAVIVLPTSWAVAAAGTIAGRVRHASTGEYLNNARVVIVGTDRAALTDSYGNYRFVEVPAGTVQVAASYTGMSRPVASVTVTAGQVATHDFELSLGTEDAPVLVMQEFQVTAERQMTGNAIAINEQRYASNIKTVVSSDEFGSVTEGNVGEFAKFLPGVTVDYTAADVRSISVRGMPSFNTNVTVDGSRMASAASGAASRVFELEQVSINNVARIEVVKSPTPDIAASSVGGAVNMVSKSAFERTKPELNYRATLSLNSEWLDMEKTPGPGPDRNSKAGVGADLSYINPVSKKFGFTVNALESNIYNPQFRANPVWFPTSMNAPAAGYGTAENPMLTRVTYLNGPKRTGRTSLGGGFDWKVTEHGVLSLSGQWNYYDGFFGNTLFTPNTLGTRNVVPTAWGPTFTQGAPTAGLFMHESSVREKTGTTSLANLKYRHRGPVWELDGAASYSRSSSHYRDMDKGYFERTEVASRNLTVRLDDIGPRGPGRVSATDASGAAFDYRNLSNYRLEQVYTTPSDAVDTVKSANFGAAREFDIGVPVKIKVGGDVVAQDRDIKTPRRRWQFRGPDGVFNTADDSVANYDLTGVTLGDLGFPYGWSDVQLPSNAKAYELFKQHPEYFVEDEVYAIQQRANNSRQITETITSGYLRTDFKLFRNRVGVVAGVRYEHTNDDGYGILNDITATYQRNPDGSFQRNANGTPVRKSGTAAELARMQYTERGAHAERSYDDFFPSMNVGWNMTENIVMRTAYAQTISRPNLNVIIPGVTVPNLDSVTAQRLITVNNTGLKPWTAQNYDFSLEYYYEPAGLLSAGVFYKDIKDFFGTTRTDATPELLEQYGLDEAYLDYDVQYLTNVGDASILGYEVNFRQRLDMIPVWGKSLQIFANGTKQEVEGSAIADFSGFIEESANWGITLSRPKFLVMLKWNYRGQQRRDAIQGANVPVQTYEYYAPRTTLDADFEWRLHKRFTLFVNARNVFNEPHILERYNAQTPDYARQYQEEEFGIQFVLGVKGRF